MQKDFTKAMRNEKKYGKKYERMGSLRKGDKKMIAEMTGLAYMTVIQQLDGNRTLRDDVKAAADSLADNNEKLIQKIESIKN